MNAIILAAGKGERLLPLTLNIPKPLLKVLDERIIERQIKFLQEVNVDHITIVVGYLHKEFLYLMDKYLNIEIIVNDSYDSTNNFYSLFLVRNKLKNTWIIEGDVFLVKNVFIEHDKSVYYSSLKPVVQYEWYFEYDENKLIQSIHIADKQSFPDMFNGHYNINMGVSFWHEDSCKRINGLLEKIYKSEQEFNHYKKGYWDKLILDYLDNFDVYMHLVDANDWYEIDSIRDMYEITRKIQSKNC